MGPGMRRDDTEYEAPDTYRAATGFRNHKELFPETVRKTLP